MIQMVSADVDGYSNATQECLPDLTCFNIFFREEKNKGKKYLVKMKSPFYKNLVFISLSVLTAIPYIKEIVSTYISPFIQM